jgi:hypothetical protein
MPARGARRERERSRRTPSSSQRVLVAVKYSDVSCRVTDVAPTCGIEGGGAQRAFPGAASDSADQGRFNRPLREGARRLNRSKPLRISWVWARQTTGSISLIYTWSRILAPGSARKANEPIGVSDTCLPHS